jgi:hypothetical protein
MIPLFGFGDGSTLRRLAVLVSPWPVKQSLTRVHGQRCRPVAPSLDQVLLDGALAPLGMPSYKKILNAQDVSLRMEHLGRGEGERKNGDVVLLAEGLCSLGDGFGGLAADGGSAVEAEELAGCASGFDHPIGDKRQGISGSEPGQEFPIVSLRGNSERQAGWNIDLLAVSVW